MASLHRKSSTVVVSAEMARMLHRIQQIRNANPEAVIKIYTTEEASLALECGGQVETITRRKGGKHAVSLE